MLIITQNHAMAVNSSLVECFMFTFKGVTESSLSRR